MSRSGPPKVRDSYSLLVHNVSYRITPDVLFPLFDRYGEVIDIHIPRDRRTGYPRGFAFVRYKYQDEAQMAVDKLDGKMLDGRAIIVQFAKYGPNAERIERGRIVERIPKPSSRSRSRSPRRSYRVDYRDRGCRSQSRNRSRERYARDRYKDSDYPRHSRSRSISPDYDKRHGRHSRSSVRTSSSRSRSSSPHRAPPREGAPSRPSDERSPCSRSPSAKA